MADYQGGKEEKAKPSKSEGMSADDFQKVVRAEVEDAISYIDDDISPLREAATQYYRGALFGDEKEGRSKVVSRDVHDTVGAILPSLLRIFFGPERVVEFVPQSQEDVAMAEQATDYVNYVAMRDNPGFEILLAVFKDALIRKDGVAKYWWDDSVTVKTVEYTGLTLDNITKLLEDMDRALDAEIIESSDGPEGLNITLKLKTKRDRVRIEAVPPEEFLIDRNARSDSSFTFIGHRRTLPVSDLVAMGYDYDEVMEAAGEDDLADHPERLAREANQQTSGTAESDDESQEPVLYVEGFLKADKDGDGIAELYKVCCIGSAHKVLHEEPADDHPFACFPADPEPHTFFGDCPAEKVMDIQKVKSGLHRAALDSLGLSIYPRTIVGPGANVDDVMNTEIGAIMRTTVMANIAPVTMPFTGQHAYPMLEYMDRVRENRTGMSQVSMGLNPEALRNTTATAADNQFSKAHEHIEIIARVFAETGMKRLFRGILRLSVENQRQSRMVQLRNQWVQVDPRAWKTDMDVTANVALGGGSNTEKILVLSKVAEKQEMIIANYGPDNPLCGVAEYHTTLTKLLALSGFKNGDAFFKDPSKQTEAPAEGQGAQPPDPKVIEAQMKASIEDKKMQLEYQKHQDDLAFRAQEMQIKYGSAFSIEQLKANMQAMRIDADLRIQASEANNRREIARERPRPNGQAAGSA